MIFTWLYLFVGVLGNFHQKQPLDIADNASVHSNQKILRFEQTVVESSKSIGWHASQKILQKDVYPAATISPAQKKLSLEIKRTFANVEPSLSKVFLCAFTNRGPPSSLS